MSKLSDLLNKPSTPAAGVPPSAPATLQSNTADTAAGSSPLAGLIAKKSATPVSHAQVATANIEIRNQVDDWPTEQVEEASDLRERLSEYLQTIRDTLITNDVSDALARCMKFIDEHPPTKDLLLPEEIGVMVKALQSSHGVVIAKKTERKSSRAKNAAEVESLAGELADIGFSL
jgi:hypothetical protein